jgi:hypothetical protein
MVYLLQRRIIELSEATTALAFSLQEIQRNWN